MLSLKSGKPICNIDGDRDKNIFLREAEDDEEADIETTDDNKMKIFKEYIKRDPKLSIKDINMMVDAFKSGKKEIENTERSLDRKYDSAYEYTNNSVKHFLCFNKTTKLFPVIDHSKEPNWRVYITGQSGSGKTWFAKQFLKVNRRKGQEIYVFSPFEDDISLNGLKDVIHVDIEDVEENVLGRPFDIDDIPKGSIVVFDDIDSSRDKRLVKKLEFLRDKCLQIGRHDEYDLSTVCINHNPMAGTSTKSAIRESGYFCCFPKWNLRDTKALLTTYAGYTKEMMDELLKYTGRWVFVCKRSPSYWISENCVRLF